MENIIDDNDAYFRLRSMQKCSCVCTKHCGFSCMTDGCDCFECECVACKKTENGDNNEMVS